MTPNGPQLPIEDAIPELLTKLATYPCVVLVAEPGAGKSTRVPVHLEAARAQLGLGDGKIVMLQPRRVAARALAEWIAHENGWSVGREIGYQVRFDKKTSSRTRIEIITEGLLVQRLLQDPGLADTSCVILDEFHERSVHLDLSLALLKETASALRPELKVVIMSATLDAGPLLQYWPQSALVTSPGRQFSVQATYAPTPLSLAGGPDVIDRVFQAVVNVVDARPSGNILVFLPGVNEIRRLVERAQSHPRCRGFRVYALHGQMTLDEQIDVLNPSAELKIIFSTNIAETSLTVDNVTTVIDSGLVRLSSFDRRTGVENLSLARVSRSSQRQRQGRAGRQREGICLKLWSKADDLSTPDQTPPEVLRTDLAGTLLVLAAWGVRDFENFDWFEKPHSADLIDRRKFLQMLELLSPEGQLTPLGSRLRAWPAPPRLARLIFESASLGYAERGAAAAAILAERDFVLAAASLDEFVHEDSDLAARLSLLDENRGSARVHASGRRVVHQLAESYERFGSRDLKVPTAPFEVALLRCFPDRVCKRRPGSRKAKMVGGRGIELSPRSLCLQAEYFIALELRAQDNQADLQCALAHPVSLDILLSTFAGQLRTVSDEYQSETGRWIKRDVTYLDDLELGFAREIPFTAEASRDRWQTSVRQDPLATLQRHPAFQRWYERAQIYRRHGGTLDLSSKTLTTWVEYWTTGHPNFDSALQISPLATLPNLLPAEARRALDREVPDHLQVPSGSWISVQYRRDDPPILSVRLQELFGWTQTPKLAFGQLPLVLELLAPNYRPLQITQDLQSFWSKTYFEIRQELRLRYPKHSWPTDPLVAVPVAKGGVKRR